MLQNKVNDYLDYVFSINPYSPQMSEVEDAFTRLASTPIFETHSLQATWNSLGQVEQFIAVAEAFVAEFDKRLENVSEPHVYQVGPYFQLVSSLRDLKLKQVALHQHYMTQRKFH